MAGILARFGRLGAARVGHIDDAGFPNGIMDKVTVPDGKLRALSEQRMINGFSAE
jgi:hypothetical protein